MLQKRELSIDQVCWIMTSRESGVNASQLFTVENCCVHYTIMKKLKVINYPFEIPSDTQHDLLSKTILLIHTFSLSAVLGQNTTHFSSSPETTTIRMIFKQFIAGVVDTSSLLLLLIHSQFVRNFSAASARSLV